MQVAADYLAFTLLAFTSLLAIVNPISAVPLYLAVTADYDSAHRRRTLRLAVVIGSDMLAARRSRAKTTDEEDVEAEQRDEVGIIPLGIPTLAGPGAIT